MSTLTKIFVVLLVVFSIAFTMSSISFVAQTNNWRSLAEGYQKQFEVADTTLRNTIAAHAAEKGYWTDTFNTQLATIASAQTERDRSKDALAEKETELAAVRSQKSGVDAVVAKLTNELAVAQAGWEEHRKQRDDLEQGNIELQKRNLDLNERVNEMTAKIVVLTQQNRQYEQQVNIVRDENQRLAQASQRPPLPVAERTAGGSMDGVAAATPVASSAIRGRVLEVDGNLVSISVGSADGVQRDMVFVVYRGSDYVGDVRITDVEPNRAAGRLIRSKSLPRVDDAVADEARFGMAP